MFKVRIFRAMALAVLSLAAAAARASDVDLLLDLLVRKQVVSAQEAAALRAEIASEAAQRDSGVVVRTAALTTTQAPAAPPQQAASATQERPVTGASAIRLGGYVQTRWTVGVGTTNPLEIRRARWQVGGSLTPRLAYRTEVELTRSPVLLDARLDYNSSPFARLTAGQFKIPFSQENLTSDRDTITIERSLVGNSLVPGRDNGSNGRDIGFQAEGDFLGRPGRGVVAYSAALLQGAGISRRDDNRRRDVAVRLLLRPIPELTLAGDYYDGASGPERSQRDRAAVELAYVRGPYTLLGEYVWGRDGAVHRRGGYGLFAWRFLPGWEGVARFDRYEPTRQQRTDTYLGGLNWLLSQWIKLQANYGVINDNSRTDNTQTVLTQLQFQF